jgi:hypothetical protein
MPYTDSEVTTATLNIVGVWLHDPLDIEGTIGNYIFGSAQRDTTVNAMEAGTFFAGREAPVFDYGEHIGRSYGVTIDVDHGPTYRAQLKALQDLAESKRSVWFRDNRGRAVHGTMSNFRIVDQKWGSSVSFAILEADRDVTLVDA